MQSRTRPRRCRRTRPRRRPGPVPDAAVTAPDSSLQRCQGTGSGLTTSALGAGAGVAVGSIKPVRRCVGTWNAGGRAPPEDLDIAQWRGTGGGDEPAHIYVLGFQEVVPLNSGNVFGAEDGQPTLAWESVIRGVVRRAQPPKPKYRFYSHAPALAVAVRPAVRCGEPATPRKLSRLNHFSVVDDSKLNGDEPDGLDQEPQPDAPQRTLLRSLSRADRVGPVWPEQPLNLLPSRALNAASSASFKLSKLFRAYKSFRGSSRVADDNLPMIPDLDLDLDGALRKKSRSPFVRIVSKQMVIFLTVWVRSGLRKCIRTSRSLQSASAPWATLATSHLAAGEKPGDVHKQNADVQEIHRRTCFPAPGD
ncbi:type IV inositol polyphosphate 5-phosphatase 3-like [Panicum miliaceum]|uniref:Type IV inositol polyphosphate 5-phosphatase 3-like n=1 Tax=Panicum miliaceum TaxID=4540 RepID=A0A3L6TK01_PANMI|nr:type IV inositol polyphosphate 5-phosphatase 3-like [Panicum miliaceum]